jgi:hypothetical protein
MKITLRSRPDDLLFAVLIRLTYFSIYATPCLVLVSLVRSHLVDEVMLGIILGVLVISATAVVRARVGDRSDMVASLSQAHLAKDHRARSYDR